MVDALSLASVRLVGGAGLAVALGAVAVGLATCAGRRAPAPEPPDVLAGDLGDTGLRPYAGREIRLMGAIQPGSLWRDHRHESLGLAYRDGAVHVDGPASASLREDDFAVIDGTLAWDHGWRLHARWFGHAPRCGERPSPAGMDNLE